MNIDIENQAYLRLAKAVYNRAIKDYFEALATNNHGRLTEVSRFFKNDPYVLSKEEGIYMLRKIKKQYDDVVEFIENFIDSDNQRRDVPLNLNRDAILTLARLKYSPQISVNCKTTKSEIRNYGFPLYIKRRKKHGRNDK